MVRRGPRSSGGASIVFFVSMSSGFILEWHQEWEGQDRGNSSEHDKTGVEVATIELQLAESGPFDAAPITAALHGQGEPIGSGKGRNEQGDK